MLKPFIIYNLGALMTSASTQKAMADEFITIEACAVLTFIR